MHPMIIRPARPSDAASIGTIHVGTWQHAYRGQISDEILDNLSVEDRTKKWKKTLTHPKPRTGIFVAETEGKLIGFCIVNPCRDTDMSSDTGELGAIYVDAAYLGKGVGSALMEAGMDFLRKEGFKKATLWVLTSHEKSRKWYEGKGWKVEGKTKVDDRGGFQLKETRYVTNL